MYHSIYVYNVFFLILSSQTAVNWKLWFTREGCFCPINVWLTQMYSGEAVLSAESRSCFLKRDTFEGGVSFISFQFWMYEVPASALPKTTRLAVSRCSRGMEPRCNHGGFAPSIYCAGTQVLLGISEGPCDFTALWQGWILSRVCDWKMQHGFPSVEECAIRKRCVWKSPYLPLCFFSWLCLRLDSRTYGEILLSSLF